MIAPLLTVGLLQIVYVQWWKIRYVIATWSAVFPFQLASRCYQSIFRLSSMLRGTLFEIFQPLDIISKPVILLSLLKFSVRNQNLKITLVQIEFNITKLLSFEESVEQFVASKSMNFKPFQFVQQLPYFWQLMIQYHILQTLNCQAFRLVPRQHKLLPHELLHHQCPYPPRTSVAAR